MAGAALALTIALGWFVYVELKLKVLPVEIPSDMLDRFSKLRPGGTSQTFTWSDVSNQARELHRDLEQRRPSTTPGVAFGIVGLAFLFSGRSRSGGER